MEPLDTRRNRPASSNAKEPLRESGSQTAGPYVHIGCLPNWAGIKGVYKEDLSNNRKLDKNDTITIKGQVFEGEGEVCKDIMLEFWQADEAGSYENGIWQRTCTSFETGEYSIDTVLPGTMVDQNNNALAPFINVWVVARGINIGLLTRIYFSDLESANASDPHLSLVPEDRRHTLFARTGPRSREYEFDIHLQGPSETVFFES